jgi:predicted ATPase with chaperone activity
VVNEATSSEETRNGDSGDNPWSYVAPAPLTVQETGIPEAFLRELVLKALWLYDMPTLGTLSDVTGLHPRVLSELIHSLKREDLCEVDSAEPAAGVQFRYRTTERGRNAAREALERSRYVGVAPVSVNAYNEVIAEQVRRFQRPPMEDVKAAISHLVLSDDLVRDLGQAFFSRRALMIYGPSGNGKTEIVTSIAKMAIGTIVIPYALHGHGQLIRVFDPDVHKSQVENRPESDDVFTDSALRHDRRWLPVSRPTVIVGGDMGAEALEMRYDSVQGLHNAPLSVVAQGGVLVIDDLGRQKVSPREILNRWVIMMEQGFDSFALSTSEIVRLPLDVTLIFSTNLTIDDLMDEAYLRRIAYKIAIPDLTQEQMAEITRRVCDKKGVAYTDDAVHYLVERLFAPDSPTPRGCYPRDIVTTIIDGAEFDGVTPVLDGDSIDRSLVLYLGGRRSVLDEAA